MNRGESQRPDSTSATVDQGGLCSCFHADISSSYGVTSEEGRSCRGNLQQVWYAFYSNKKERLCASGDDSTREVDSLAGRASLRNEKRRSRKPTKRPGILSYARSPNRLSHCSDYQQVRRSTRVSASSSAAVRARGEAWRTLGHTCGLIVGRNLENNTYSCALTRRTLRCGDAVELMMWSDKTIRIYGQSELGN